MGVFALIVLGFIVLVVLIGLSSAIRIINEYERGVLFRLGRLMALKGPGLRLIIPFGIDRLVKIDLRTVTLEVPPQEVITLDNVTIKVNAVIYFLVVDPRNAVTKVANFINATSQIAQTTLRSVLGQSSLDELLANREKINTRLQKIIDEQTEPWRIKVSTVEIKDVELPQTMQRAMAKQAEAEREKRAKIIHAEGEFEAAQKLTDAAGVIATQPSALQLRYLQTLTEIGVERNTVIVFRCRSTSSSSSSISARARAGRHRQRPDPPSRSRRRCRRFLDGCPPWHSRRPLCARQLRRAQLDRADRFLYRQRCPLRTRVAVRPPRRRRPPGAVSQRGGKPRQIPRGRVSRRPADDCRRPGPPVLVASDPARAGACDPHTPWVAGYLPHDRARAAADRPAGGSAGAARHTLDARRSAGAGHSVAPPLLCRSWDLRPQVAARSHRTARPAPSAPEAMVAGGAGRHLRVPGGRLRDRTGGGHAEPEPETGHQCDGRAV